MYVHLPQCVGWGNKTVRYYIRGLIGMSYLYKEKCKTETGRQGRLLGLGQQEPFSLRVLRLATISLSGIYNGVALKYYS